MGYFKVFIRSGVWGGAPLPAHQTMYIRVAPVDMLEAIIAFADNQGGADSMFTAADLYDVRVASDGRVFFGFGAGGMLAAGVAARLDHLLAPWELRMEGPLGFVEVYAHRGPPPSRDELARVEQRLAMGARSAPPTADGDAAEEYAELMARVVRSVELGTMRESAHGVELIRIDLERMWIDEEVEISSKVAGALRGALDALVARDLLPSSEDDTVAQLRVAADTYHGHPKHFRRVLKALRECGELGVYELDDATWSIWSEFVVLHEMLAANLPLFPIEPA